MKKDDVYIVSACRTGIGALNGQFKDVPAYVLGATVIKHCLYRAEISPENISEVIMGQALTAGQGQNPARQSAIAADIPMTTSAYTVNMLGNSGLKAICLGYQAIRSGDSKFVVCGGQENMTMAQHSVYIRNSSNFHTGEVQDTMIIDGLIDAFTGLEMGEIAEHFASAYNISRQMQDKFAYQSHLKVMKAIENQYFSHETVPVYRNTFEADTIDELVQPKLTQEQFSEMPLMFEDNLLEDGTITEGNSSANGDCAAAVVLCNNQQIETLNLIPLARIVSFAQTAVEPMEIGLAGVKAIEKVLSNANWIRAQVDLYEIDESFACQALYIVNKLELNLNKVNVAGGAIALGNPLGANGARILVTLLHNLHRLGLNRGVAVAGNGGSMAIAIAIDRPVF